MLPGRVSANSIPMVFLWRILKATLESVSPVLSRNGPQTQEGGDRLRGYNLNDSYLSIHKALRRFLRDPTDVATYFLSDAIIFTGPSKPDGSKREFVE